MRETQIIDILNRTISDVRVVRPKHEETSQVQKTATVVIKKIRDAILDDVFKPCEARTA